MEPPSHCGSADFPLTNRFSLQVFGHSFYISSPHRHKVGPLHPHRATLGYPPPLSASAWLLLLFKCQEPTATSWGECRVCFCKNVALCKYVTFNYFQLFTSFTFCPSPADFIHAVHRATRNSELHSDAGCNIEMSPNVKQRRLHPERALSHLLKQNRMASS